MIPLLEIMFDASAILVIAIGVMPLLRRRSAALRHYVLCTALLCAAAAPVVELIVPAWRLPISLRADAFNGASTTRRVAPRGQATTPAQAVGTVPAPFASSTSSPLSLWDTLVWTWAGGAAIFVATLLLGLLRLTHVTRRARPVMEGSWLDAVDQLRHTDGMARPIAVRESDRPRLLLVWGWWRPTLILPTSARDWPAERIAAVLRHELAHVRRSDWATQVTAEFVRATYWFNPLIWIVCARLRRECEQACDDVVLTGGVEGSRYAADLLDIARDLRHGAPWVPAPAIVGASTLERRVKAMLDRTTDRRPLTSRARTTSFAVLLAISLALATLAAAQQFASLAGTIVDPTNGLLPGVTLVLTNDQTKAKYEIRTDRDGRYEFVGLPVGTYSLETKLPGFSRFVGTVTVAGKNVQQDVMLSVGELQETITITGGNTPERLSPAELELREARKLQEQLTVLEIRRKRALAAANRPPAPTSGTRIGGNIRTPVKLHDVKPRYPERMQGTDGDVLLSAVIGTDGNVDRVEVVSTTHPEFSDSAIDAVKQWQFDATLLNGQPIETTMKVTLAYRWQ